MQFHSCIFCLLGFSYQVKVSLTKLVFRQFIYRLSGSRRNISDAHRISQAIWKVCGSLESLTSSHFCHSKTIESNKNNKEISEEQAEWKISCKWFYWHKNNPSLQQKIKLCNNTVRDEEKEEFNVFLPGMYYQAHTLYSNLCSRTTEFHHKRAPGNV